MKIIVFDLDETLGFFSQFGTFWELLQRQNPTLTHKDFSELLDLYPEYLRPNIVSILNFLKHKKMNQCCNKIYLYTNNQGPLSWANDIILYLEDKITHKYKLFDKIIPAYKIGNKCIEPLRTSHDKSYEDLIRCINCQTEHKICFIDDVHHVKMVHDSVYYVNVKPYTYMLPSEEIVNRFINSGHHASKHIDNNHLFSELKKYSYSEKDTNEYMIDNIVSKQLMIHLQDFLNKSKMKTNMRQKSLKK
jgi:hypothetical protein